MWTTAPPYQTHPPIQPAPTHDSNVELDPTHELPKYSDIIRYPSRDATAAVASVSTNYSRHDLDAFASKHLNARIQAVLDQPFGKPNRDQCFLNEPVLRHALVPLLKNNWLSALDWTNLAATCRTHQSFLQL